MQMPIHDSFHFIQTSHRLQTFLLMPNTDKGIYLKFRSMNDDQINTSIIKDIHYENINMTSPNVPIWIGPAQQADSIKFWVGHPASITWPWFGTCPGALGKFKNITLKDIRVANPKSIKTRGVGVVRANKKVPMEDLLFDNVVMESPSEEKYAYYYSGQNLTRGSILNSVSLGDTWPVPHYFLTVNETINTATA